MTETGAPLFEFECSDSLARFGVFVWTIVPTGGLAYMAAYVFGWPAGATVCLIGMVIGFGLRNTLRIYPDRTEIVRTWYGVPYRSHSGEVMDHVCFSGDYGLPGGANGIVIVFDDGREIAFGNPRNMRHLQKEVQKFARTQLHHLAD